MGLDTGGGVGGWLLDETVRPSKHATRTDVYVDDATLRSLQLQAQELVAELEDIAGGLDEVGKRRPLSFARLDEIRQRFVDKGASLRAQLCRALGIQDTAASSGSAFRVNYQRVDLEQVLGANVVDLEYAPVEEVIPLVQFYVDRTADELLVTHKGRDRELVRLGQVLVTKFCNEYFLIKRSMQDLQETLKHLDIQDPAASRGGALHVNRLGADGRDPEHELMLNRANRGGTSDVGLPPGHSPGLPCRDARSRTGPKAVGDVMVREVDKDVRARVHRRSAAVVIQSAWRRRQVKYRVHQHLWELVFQQVPRRSRSVNTTDWLGQLRAPKEGETVRSVLAVQGVVARVLSRLCQHGLDSQAAFRCADRKYPHSIGEVSVDDFLDFLSERQHIKLLPAEVAMLERLFVAMPGRDETSLMTYAHSAELAFAFAPRAGPPTADTAFLKSKPVQIVRDALANAGEVDFSWPQGRLKPSWRRLLVDAHIAHLLEEQERLRGKSGDDKDRDHDDLLAVCDARLAAMRRRGASPHVLEAVAVARLLRVGLKDVSPVTVHAAVRAVCCSEDFERRVGCAKVCAGSKLLVDFDKPLPAAPSLLHITAVPDAPWTIDLLELSERGMRLDIRPRVSDNNMPAPHRLEADLRIRFSAGLASGTVDVGKFGQSRQAVEVPFIPRLPSPPAFVTLESCQALAATQPQVHHRLPPPSPPLRELVQQPTACSFMLCLRSSGDAPTIWHYEAVSTELSVSAARLQELAPLPEVAGEEDADAEALREALRGHLTEGLPFLRKPTFASEVLAVSGGSSEPGEDDEVHFRELMNARAQQWLVGGRGEAGCDASAVAGGARVPPLSLPPNSFTARPAYGASCEEVGELSELPHGAREVIEQPVPPAGVSGASAAAAATAARRNSLPLAMT